MSKAVFLSFPFYGHVNPTLELARELVTRGEEVVYYSDDRFESEIKETGAVFRSYGDIKEFTGEEAVGGVIAREGKFEPVQSLVYGAMGMLEMSRKVLENISDEVKAERPGYIIKDTDCYWGRKLAQKLNVPAVSIITTFAAGSGMIDADPGYFAKNILRADLQEISSDGIREIMDRASGEISRIYGMKQFDVMDVFTAPEALNIVYTSKCFQPLADTFDDSFVFIGPSIRTSEKATDFPLDMIKGSPLVYISMGTIFNNCTDFYRQCFEAFGDAESQVVLSAGSKVDIPALGDIPPNFIVRNFVPQLEVLKRADVFVTHGGNSSIAEAIRSDVPLVVIPQGADQFAMAGQIERLEAGIYLKSGELSAMSLREAVKRIFEDEKYRNGSKKIRESFETAGGASKAADAILNFVEEQNPFDL